MFVLVELLFLLCCVTDVTDATSVERHPQTNRTKEGLIGGDGVSKATPTTEVTTKPENKSENKIASLSALMETLIEIKKEMKENINTIKTEIGIVNTEISHVRSEMKIMKSQLTDLRSEMNTVKTDIEGSVEKESSKVKKSIVSEITEAKKCMTSKISELGKDTSKIGSVQSAIDNLRTDITDVKSDTNLLMHAPPYPQYALVFKGYGSCQKWEDLGYLQRASLEDCLSRFHSERQGGSSWNDVHYDLSTKYCWFFKGGVGHNVDHNKIHYHLA